MNCKLDWILMSNMKKYSQPTCSAIIIIETFSCLQLVNYIADL